MKLENVNPINAVDSYFMDGGALGDLITF